MTQLILVVFHRFVGAMTAEKILRGFGPAFLDIARVLEENEHVYVVRVPAKEVKQVPSPSAGGVILRRFY